MQVFKKKVRTFFFVRLLQHFTSIRLSVCNVFDCRIRQRWRKVGVYSMGTCARRIAGNTRARKLYNVQKSPKVVAIYLFVAVNNDAEPASRLPTDYDWILCVALSSVTGRFGIVSTFGSEHLVCLVRHCHRLRTCDGFQKAGA